MTRVNDSNCYDNFIVDNLRRLPARLSDSQVCLPPPSANMRYMRNPLNPETEREEEAMGVCQSTQEHPPRAC